MPNALLHSAQSARDRDCFDHDGDVVAECGGTLRASKWFVLCDFDGTISLGDVTDLLLQRFAKDGWQEIEASWVRGEIGSRACMAAQIGLLDLGKSEFDAWLTEIEIDPAFAQFVSMARAHGIPLTVASDGLDYVIQSILTRHGLGSIPIVANRLVPVSERGWRLDSPHARDDCRNASGTCKCALLKAAQQTDRVLHIGDGASDYCVSHHVDALLAKGRLIEYAQRAGIPHVPMDDFRSAFPVLDELSADRFAVVGSGLTA